MRTTLDLDEELLKQVQRETGAATKTAAIELGLRTLLQQCAARRLAALAGKVPEAQAPGRRRGKGEPP